MDAANPKEAPPPRANPDLIGREAAERALLAAWNSGRMPHAWLIAGPRGIGKATLAYRFARFVLAQGEEAGGGGGLFASAPPSSLALAPDDPVFRRVAAGGHADLFVLEPGQVNPETGKPSAEIVVGSVRRTIAALRKTAAEGGWRIAIVDPAESMNRNAANALLKILEEPPARCLLLLVSHAPRRLPPTVRSRCRLLALSPLPDAEVSRLLARFRPDLDAEARRAAVALAPGSIGRGLEMADGDGVALAAEIEALLAHHPTLAWADVHAFAARVAQPGGADPAAPFRLVVELLRAWVVRRIAAGGRVERLFEARERIGRCGRLAEAVNLDRRIVLLDAFRTLASVE